MSRRPIGPVDTIWLNMDRANNLMVIDSLMFLDGPVDWDRFVETARVRLLGRYPVFTQRAVQPAAHVGTPHWEDDPDFDVERHLVRTHLGGGDAALQRYVAQHMCLPLDRRYPLWQIHLIDGYDGGAVVYFRLHHALADGIALAQVLLEMTDATAESEPRPVDGDQETAMGVLEGAWKVVEAAGSAAGAVLSSGAQLLREAPRLLDPHLVGDAFTLVERTGAIADKLLLSGPPDTPFSGVPGVEKRAVWCRPFPLEDVKAVGRVAGATVNDVLMAAIAGGLARYVESRGAEPRDVKAMVPVNVRPLDEPLPRDLGNQFALVLLDLPVGVTGPFARIAEAKRRMDVIKHSPEVVLTFDLIKAIGRTGPELERYFVDFFAAKAIGVLTNVPGPRQWRYIAGTRITRVISWGPQSGDQTLGVAVFTYAGSVHVGFKVDAGLVPDPEAMVTAFETEIAELGRVAHAV